MGAASRNGVILAQDKVCVGIEFERNYRKLNFSNRQQEKKRYGEWHILSPYYATSVVFVAE